MGLVQDVKFLANEAHATEAVGAVRTVVARAQVGRGVAVFAANQVRAAVARSAIDAVQAFGATPTPLTVGTTVTGIAVDTKQALGRTGAVCALETARVSPWGREGFAQGLKLRLEISGIHGRALYGKAKGASRGFPAPEILLLITTAWRLFFESMPALRRRLLCPVSRRIERHRFVVVADGLQERRVPRVARAIPVERGGQLRLF